jgi:hypothetical protein
VIIETQRVSCQTSSIIFKAFLLDVEALFLHLVVKIELIDAAEVRVLLISDGFYDFLL